MTRKIRLRLRLAFWFLTGWLVGITIVAFQYPREPHAVSVSARILNWLFIALIIVNVLIWIAECGARRRTRPGVQESK